MRKAVNSYGTEFNEESRMPWSLGQAKAWKEHALGTEGDCGPTFSRRTLFRDVGTYH